MTKKIENLIEKPGKRTGGLFKKKDPDYRLCSNCLERLFFNHAIAAFECFNCEQTEGSSIDTIYKKGDPKKASGLQKKERI